MQKVMAISLLALFATVTMATAEDKKSSKLKIGDVVADQSLTTTDGKTVKLTELRNNEKGEGGKIVFVTFWSYKCPTGKRMMERNKEIAEYCKKNDVVFLAVSSYGESKEKVKEYCKEKDVEYSVAYDADQNVVKALGAQFVSTTMILDKDGKLAYRGALVSRKDKETGEQTPYAKNALLELVAGKKVKTSETTTYG